MHDLKSSLKYINSLLVQATRATFKSNELILRGLGSELLEQGALTIPENRRLLIERDENHRPGYGGFRPGKAGQNGFQTGLWSG